MQTHNIRQNARLVRVELSDRYKKTRNGNSASLLSGGISPTSYWRPLCVVSTFFSLDVPNKTDGPADRTLQLSRISRHGPARPDRLITAGFCLSRPIETVWSRPTATSLCRAVDAFYGTHVAAAARPADRAFPLLSKPGRRIVARTPRYKFCSSCPSAATL